MSLLVKILDEESCEFLYKCAYHNSKKCGGMFKMWLHEILKYGFVILHTAPPPQKKVLIAKLFLLCKYLDYS